MQCGHSPEYVLFLYVFYLEIPTDKKTKTRWQFINNSNDSVCGVTIYTTFHILIRTLGSWKIRFLLY